MKAHFLKVSLLVTGTMYVLFGCSSTPEKTIHQRWQIENVRGNHGESFLESGDKTFVLEFTKDNVFNIYSGGALTNSYPYVMASDGKSLLVKDPTITDGMPMTILSLESKKLVMTSRMFQNDTLVLKAR